MDTSLFGPSSLGELIRITGSDPVHGDWEHQAFLPQALPEQMPNLSMDTVLRLTDARAELAALDSTARRLPNPELLRQPSIRREAQSTSALEGTYAPLQEVLAAESVSEPSAELREVVNYVKMANYGYAAISVGRSVSPALVNELHRLLMRGTRLEHESGDLRRGQVVIGRSPSAAATLPRVKAARFVPVPAGDHLVAGIEELFSWKSRSHRGRLDPLVKAGMGHYQFETLHPYRDGNGRLGRYLITTDLIEYGVLTEPTLTVSPWFEARREPYYDALLSVSTVGDWDGYLSFFFQGLAAAAHSTHRQMLDLLDVQAELKDKVREAKMRSESAQAMVDLALAELTFSTSVAAKRLAMSDGGARKIAEQLVELGVLQIISEGRDYRRWYFSPRVFEVLSRRDD